MTNRCNCIVTRDNRILQMMAVISAIILGTSCSRDLDDSPPPPLLEDMEIRLCAVINDITDTRAATDLMNQQFGYTAPQGTSPAVSECVNVEIIDAKIDQDGNPTSKPLSPTRASYIFKTVDIAGGLKPNGTKPFFPASGNKVNIYAYYPSTFGTTSTSPDYVWTGNPSYTTFTVATDQSTAQGYTASDLMCGTPASNPVARTNEAISLSFAHKLCKVIVRIKPKADGGLTAADIANAVVKMKAMISTSVTQDCVAASQTWTTTPAQQGDPVATTIDMGGVTQVGSSDVYETAAIVVPQVIPANSEGVFTITLDNGDGAEYKYKPSSAKTFAAGSVNTFTLSLGLNGANVSATISDWDGGTTESEDIIL